MRTPLIPVVFLLGLAAGCAGQPTVKPIEVLDQRTGITLGTIKEPIELMPAPDNLLVTHRRGTFVYLGPVEWNRSGDLSYGLWIHIAPGNDKPLGDIRAAGAVTLILDEGPSTLSLGEAPKNAGDAYKLVVSWGQSAYFGVTVDMLRRMAASSKLGLDVRAVDGSLIRFSPTLDTRATLQGYLQARGI